MSAERLRRLEELYHAARGQPAEARAAFLASACGDDDALRDEVLSLLGHADSVAGFLEHPAHAAIEPEDGRPLAAGSRIGPYEIVAPLGAGGMGEVYRARDSKLHRDVAIKVLPEAVAADPERLARFEREAQALAALNHPNIAAVYAVEGLAIVMELVAGEDLSARLRRGPIPLAEALPMARQIADALAAAHAAGIIHRDLKPANIKVKDDGTVKVLDFGLAKAFEPPGELNAEAMNSPPVSDHATSRGVILGTAAYMAPEQARGKAVDKRADIWAFGCVLYEMLTSQRAFHGQDASDTIAAVLRAEVDWSVLPANTSIVVRRLLRGCLEKERQERVPDIAVVQFELKVALAADPVDPRLPAGRSDRRFNRRSWLFALAALVAGVVLGAGVLHWERRAEVPSTMSSAMLRATIELPEDAPLALGTDIPALGYNSPVLALSRDGASLIYVAQTKTVGMLYFKDMSTGDVRPLPGTEGAIHAFFSPDGQWIGFLTLHHVKKIPLRGGGVIPLCEALKPVLAWWTEANLIYFTEKETSVLSRVSADGGKQETVFSSRSIAFGYAISDVLPGGQAVLATSTFRLGGDYRDILLIDTTTRDTTLLLRSGYGARYVPPGYLLFARAGNLMSVRFDLARKQVVGEPIEVAAGAAMESIWRMVHASSSNTGLLAYVPGGDLSVGKIAWVDRRGTVEYLDVPERVYGALDLAPDGSRLAVHVADVNDYNWVYDLRRRQGRRIASPEPEGFPLWNPLGRQLASYGANEPSRPSMTIIRDVDPGGGMDQIIWQGNDAGTPGSWLPPSGDVLAVWSENGVEFVGIGKAVKVAGFAGGLSTFSPDGRWIAYSWPTGILFRPYPEGKVFGPVSADAGGLEPVWNRSGELFYRNGHQWFSTQIRDTPEPHWDRPRLVFDTDFIDTPGTSYDVSPDGQRLLVVKRTRPVERTKIEILVNWPALIPK